MHLVEVERRRLHLGLGYPSLFEYCLRHLGYSSSAASRRIHSARCIRIFPEVYALLEKNEVNLSSVSLVASILTKENKDDLLMRIRNKSQKEVEAIVADYRPPVSLRDRARPVCVAVASSPSAAPGLTLSETPAASSPSEKPTSPALASGMGEGRAPTQTQSNSNCTLSRSGSEKTPNSAAGPLQATGETQAQRQATAQPSHEQPSSPAPRFERKFQVQFLASERFMKKLERAKALLSNKNGKPSYEAILEAALDEFLKDHDPECRRQRREDRQNKAGVRTKAMTRGGQSGQAQKATGPARQSSQCPEPSRRIPAATGDAVFARDKGRCTYVGSTGKRCDADHNLQIDHVVPYARGGANTLDNLRLLCERHNKLEAERIYGADAMGKFRRP